MPLAYATVKLCVSSKLKALVARAHVVAFGLKVLELYGGQVRMVNGQVGIDDALGLVWFALGELVDLDANCFDPAFGEDLATAAFGGQLAASLTADEHLASGQELLVECGIGVAGHFRPDTDTNELESPTQALIAKGQRIAIEGLGTHQCELVKPMAGRFAGAGGKD